jgi:hypothetical protein
MSLLAFQRVMADLAASPELVRRVRADAESALAAYELTPLELRRAAAAAAQAGMVVNCTLHRTNRISSILTLLPATVFLLGNELRGVADRFWARYPVPDFTTRREIRRFAAWLRGQVEEGAIDSPFLAEVVEWELAQYELRMTARKRTLAKLAADAERWPDGPLAPHPLMRVAAFRHDPAVLAPHAARLDPLPWGDIAEGEWHLLLDAREALAVTPLDNETGRLLLAIQRGAAVPADQRAEALRAAGLLVRTAPGDSADSIESAVSSDSAGAAASEAAEPALAG